MLLPHAGDTSEISSTDPDPHAQPILSDTAPPPPMPSVCWLNETTSHDPAAVHHIPPVSPVCSLFDAAVAPSNALDTCTWDVQDISNDGSISAFRPILNYTAPEMPMPSVCYLNETPSHEPTAVHRIPSVSPVCSLLDSTMAPIRLLDTCSWDVPETMNDAAVHRIPPVTPVRSLFDAAVAPSNPQDTCTWDVQDITDDVSVSAFSRALAVAAIIAALFILVLLVQSTMCDPVKLLVSSNALPQPVILHTLAVSAYLLHGQGTDVNLHSMHAGCNAFLMGICWHLRWKQNLCICLFADVIGCMHIFHCLALCPAGYDCHAEHFIAFCKG